MATSIAHEAPWRLKRRAVVVHAPQFNDVGCLADVNVSHDQTLKEGFITIKIKLKLAEFDNEDRALHLSILPGAIDGCSLIPASYSNMLPIELLQKLRGVNKAAAATTITLQLNRPSVVLVPPEVTMDSISPADPSDSDFHAVSQISRATSIRLHYPKQSFGRDDQLRFQSFASALTGHALCSPRPKYNHLNGGKGAHERDWTIFARRPELPTYEQIVLPGSILGKRSRCENSPPGPALCPPCPPPPPWSPTEVSTSSEAATPTKNDHSNGDDAYFNISTPTTDRRVNQDNSPTQNSIRSTPLISTTQSPAVSISSRKLEEMLRSDITHSVFHRSNPQPERDVRRPRSQRSREENQHPGDGCSRADNAIMDRAATETYVREVVREIVRRVVDEETQSILDDHQDMCNEAKLEISEIVEDGRLAIIEKTDESCDVIDDHSQKLQEAYAESCEFVQTEVACLEEVSAVIEKAVARLSSTLETRLSSASDRMISVSRLVNAQPAHPSALAVKIIQHDFKSLPTSTKVAMLTKIADEGFANVFVTANDELRRELITAWSKHETEK